MSLDPAYLTYSRRRGGYDHDLYSWSALKNRAPVGWQGVAIWIVVSLEWFPILAGDKPFRAPGHMQTAYPDYRNYTGRDYGTRVGFYRLLDRMLGHRPRRCDPSAISSGALSAGTASR